MIEFITNNMYMDFANSLPLQSNVLNLTLHIEHMDGDGVRNDGMNYYCVKVEKRDEQFKPTLVFTTNNIPANELFTHITRLSEQLEICPGMFAASDLGE